MTTRTDRARTLLAYLVMVLGGLLALGLAVVAVLAVANRDVGMLAVLVCLGVLMLAPLAWALRSGR